MQTQDDLKRAVAHAAVKYSLTRLKETSILGVGTGSTADFFIDALAAHRHQFAAAVSSSRRSTDRLQACGIKVVDLNDVSDIAVYVDGADEINADLVMIKGGGGALTQEKIVASVAREFVCIVDDSKLVSRLGNYPIPIEVIPLAREAVARRLEALGGQPKWRQGVVTDNAGHILDVHGLEVDTSGALALEAKITAWPGVVTCGLFAQRGADIVLVAGEDGLETRQ